MNLKHSASPEPSLAHLFTISAGIGSSDDTGEGSLGRRVRDSVGEGIFFGERLRGELLPGSADWRLKTSGLMRDSASNARPAFVVDDGEYVSARWPGDTHTFAATVSAKLLGS